MTMVHDTNLVEPQGLTLWSSYGDEDDNSTCVYPHSGSSTVYALMWHSQHWTFQVGFMVRYRLKAEIGLNGVAKWTAYPKDDKGDYKYTGYGENTTMESCNFKKSDAATVVKMPTDSTGSSTFQWKGVAYDTTKYDCMQVHAIVRAIDEVGSDGRTDCGVTYWHYNNLYIRQKFVPTITANITAKGVMGIVATSDWGHYAKLTVKSITDNSGNRRTINAKSVGNGGRVSVSIGASNTLGMWSGEKCTIEYEYETFCSITDCTEYGSATVTLGGNKTFDTTPTMATSIDSTGTLTVRCTNSSSFETVAGTVSFTSKDGEYRTIALVFSGGKATTSLIPCGCAMKVAITGIKEDKIASTRKTLSAWSDECAWLIRSDEGKRVRVAYNIDIDDDFSPDMETIKTVGNTRPVSRYGEGGERSVKVSTVALRDEFDKYNPDYATVEDFNTLPKNNTQDWVLRAPDGTYYPVAISSVSASRDHDNKVLDISLSLTEVMSQ